MSLSRSDLITAIKTLTATDLAGTVLSQAPLLGIGNDGHNEISGADTAWVLVSSRDVN